MEGRDSEEKEEAQGRTGEGLGTAKGGKKSRGGNKMTQRMYSSKLGASPSRRKG